MVEPIIPEGSMDTFDDIQSLTERINANKPKIDMKRLNQGLEQVKAMAAQENKRKEAERKKLEQMQKAADVLKSRQLVLEQQDDETEAARQRDMANAGDAAITAMGGGVDGEPEPPTFEAVLQPSADLPEVDLSSLSAALQQLAGQAGQQAGSCEALLALALEGRWWRQLPQGPASAQLLFSLLCYCSDEVLARCALDVLLEWAGLPQGDVPGGPLDVASCSPCQLPWTPTAQHFMEALHAHGYPKQSSTRCRKSTAAAAAAAAAATPAATPAADINPQARLTNLQLMLRLLQRLCQLSAAGGPQAPDLEVGTGHGKALAAALAHLQLDCSVGALLAPELQLALGALLDVVDVERHGSDIAELLLQLGPSHRARLHLLAQLPDVSSSQRALQAVAVYMALRKELQPSSTGRIRHVGLAEVTALVPIQQASELASKACGTSSSQATGSSSASRSRGSKRPDKWKLLTLVQLLDLLMWPLATGAYSQDDRRSEQEAEAAVDWLKKVLQAWDPRRGTQDLISATLKATITAVGNKFELFQMAA